MSEAWEGDVKAVQARVASAVAAGFASNGRLAGLIEMANERMKGSGHS